MPQPSERHGLKKNGDIMEQLCTAADVLLPNLAVILENQNFEEASEDEEFNQQTDSDLERDASDNEFDSEDNSD